MVGTANVFVISKQPAYTDGTILLYDCNTVKNINSDLMSLTHWYKELGYDVHLQHSGFTGLTKSDSSGNIVHRIPVDFDDTRDAWIVDYVIARDAATAERAGRELQSQLQQRTPANYALAANSLILDTGMNIVDVIQTYTGHAMTIRDADSQIYLDTTTADNLVQIYTETKYSRFFSPTAFMNYHEGDYIETIDENTNDSADVNARNAAHQTLDKTDEEIQTMFKAHELMKQTLLETPLQDTGVDSALIEPSLAGVKAGLPSRDQKLSLADFHRQHGHIGSLDGCETCLKLRKTLRRVYKKIDPYIDTRVGYAWSLDAITWSELSKQGNKYTLVLRDLATGYVILIHLHTKSDATHELQKLVTKLRVDPRFADVERKYGHKIMSEIRTDPAGEWREDNKVFQAMCTELGITMVYSSPDDKRNASHAEHAVGMVERGTKAIMIENNCPVQYVEYAADQFALMHNCFPLQRDVNSRDGDAPRPLERLSVGRISRRQCDKIIHHSISVGTPCLVTIPHVKGSDIHNIARCKWGVAIKQYGDLPIFECPFTGSIFRSKGYVVFHLQPGQDAWTFLGLESPVLSAAQYKRTPGRDEPLQHYVQLDIPTTTITPNPVIESIETAQTQTPRIVTLDKHGTIFVPDSTGTLVPTLDKIPALAIEPAVTEYTTIGLNSQLDAEALHVRPETFMGRDVYKYFPGHGVCHGVVVETNTDKDTNDMIWLINYDDGEKADFTVPEMMDYCVNYVDGQTILSETEAIATLRVQHEDDPGSDLLQGFTTYETQDNDTFFEVCRACGLPPADFKLYYSWLQQHFNYGHQSDSSKPGLKFAKPWGGTGQKPESKQSKFKVSTKFPIPSGDTWQTAKDQKAQESNYTNSEYIQARAIETMNAWEYMQVKLQSRADRDGQTIQSAIKQMRENLLHEFEVHTDSKLENLKSRITAGTTTGTPADDTRNLNSRSNAYATKLTPDLQQLVDNNKYIDKVTGKIKAPTSVQDAKRRDDWLLWKWALDQEYKALDELGVFSHGHTLSELRKKGINQSPVPQKVIFVAKYDPEGNFVKPKARNCIAGHPGVMKKGEHYFATFAAAPRGDTTRVLQAISVGKGYSRSAFDINVAFPKAECKDYERIPLRYPTGMDRKDSEGNTLFALLERNLYGSPAAPRRFAQARNKWMLQFFNENGWICTKLRFDPCLFKIISPQGKWTFLLVHVDDCDLISELSSDAALITAAFDKRFGVTVCDPHFLLGIQREISIKDGVTYLEMTQPDYIDSLVKQFEAEIKTRVKKRGQIESPVPPGTFLSVVGDPDHGIEPPSEQEIAEAKALGYQNAVGSLNWAARHCYPEIASGTHLLCRVMASPSIQAFDCAMHMIAYLDGQRHRGIRFRNDAPGTPVCYYDSSDKKDPKDSKAQYGYVIIMYGGPILWSSKKHNHAGRSSTDNEYMCQAHACTAVMWVRGLLREMGFGDLISEPTPLMGDNDQATNLACDDILTQANRYFRLEYHFCKECFEAGDTSPLRVAGVDNIADVLTKSLAAPVIARLRPGLTGYASLPSPPPRPRD